jgi:hypothetical protein
MLQDVLINLKTNTQNSKKTNLLEFLTYLKLQHVFVGVFYCPEFILRFLYFIRNFGNLSSSILKITFTNSHNSQRILICEKNINFSVKNLI